MQLQDLATKISAGPDSTIILVFIAITLYGMLLGQNKVKTLAMSVYVGIVVASQLGDALFGFLNKNGIHLGGSSGPGLVKLGLFVLPLIILEFGRRSHSRGGGHSGFLMTMILAVTVSALVISSGIWLLGPDTAKRLTDESTLAMLIYKTRLWWIGLTPLAVIGENFIKPREH